MYARTFLAATLARFGRPAFYLFLLLTLLAPSLTTASAASQDDKFWSVYDPQPQHPWNRVFRVLYEEDGEWPYSVLRGPRHKEVLATLDHFLNTRAERLFDDPVKRALFQNDLWKFFNWTLPYLGIRDDPPAQLAVRQRLVRIMRRVALHRAEIENLPDTYASAIRAGMHPAAYDPNNRQQAFLPPDLWEENGPWALLGSSRDNRPPAIMHAHQMGGASDFFVLLSLPGGRVETVRMLEQFGVLRYLHEAAEVARRKRDGAKLLFVPDVSPYDDKEKLQTWLQSLPPVGTRAALVRQMRVIDTNGYSYATRIIESVQMRVYRDARQPAQYPPAADPRDHTSLRPSPQDAYMFRLDRKALAAGQSNSLRAVTVGEYTHAGDVITGRPPPAEVRPVDRVPPPNAHAARLRLVDSCAMCHSSNDLYSLQIVGRASMIGDTVPNLYASKREHQEGSGDAVQQYRLGYLRAMWDSVRD